ncbi:hypothetical protein B0H19DRAFT_165581 [Mycena capillaripes]|nr:hypothetical protein B0H19DRAFT_165581 [Mycena capillaripes]
MADAVRRAMQVKPASFFHASVRHVYIRRASSQWTEAQSHALLRLCPRLISLATVARWTPKTMLPVLEELTDVRRWGGCLHDLFGAHSAVDLGLPFFRGLTHIDVFERFGVEEDPLDDDGSGRICVGLATLPALTHLCLNRGVPQDVLQRVLKDCAHLQLLVSKWGDAKRARESAAATLIVDVRYVVAVTGEDAQYWADWEVGTRGGTDFWAAADAFVARKRSGEIDASSYLLEKW